MAKGQEVEIYISPQGELKVHIKGVHGPDCVKKAQALAKGAGKLKCKKLTSEYYQKAESKTSSYVRR